MCIKRLAEHVQQYWPFLVPFQLQSCMKYHEKTFSNCGNRPKLLGKYLITGKIRCQFKLLIFYMFNKTKKMSSGNVRDFCHATAIFARVRIPWEAFLQSFSTSKFCGCIFSCVFFFIIFVCTHFFV